MSSAVWIFESTWQKDVVCTERGTALFFLLIALPLVCAFSVFSLDLSRYYLKQNDVQKTADRIALGAATHLPDVVLAKNAVFRQAALLAQDFDIQRDHEGRPELVVSDSQISLSIRSSLRPMLTGLLALPGFDDIEFEVKQTARVQLRPRDTVLIFSDSAALAPAQSELWGDESLWPASSALEGLQFVCPDQTSCFSSQSEARRWMTQRCFNPRFNAVKQSLVDLLEVFGASTRDRLSVLATPGSNSEGAYDEITAGLEPASHPALAPWSGWQHPRYGYSDDLCLYASNPMLHTETPYSSIANTSSTCSMFPFATRPDVFLPQGSIQNCFLSGLKLGQRIWSHASRERILSDDDFETTVNAAIGQLVSSAPDAASASRLSYRAKRSIIAVLDRAPRITAQQMASIARFRIRLNIVVYQDEQYLHDFESAKDAQRRIQTIQQGHFPGIRISYAETSESLRRALSEMVLAQPQEVIVTS